MNLLHRNKAFDVKALPWAAMEEALGAALARTVASATDGAIAAALARGLDFDMDLVAEAIAEMLPGYTDAWLAEVIQTTQDRTAAAVARYTAGEIGIDELMASIDTLFDPARASLMAVTETTRLYDVIGQVINETAGVEKVRYLTVRDPWVCPICSPMDNEVFDIDDAPHPPLDTHPNCRCFLAPEVPEAQSREPVAA